MSSDKRRPTRKTFMAIYRLEQEGIEPISYLKQVYEESMAAYKAGRGLNDKSDAGPAYLANALGAAKALASFKYPTLSAMAVKDIDAEVNRNDGRTMTTKEAIQIIKSDPFAPKEIKQMDISVLPDPEPGLLPIGLKKEE